MTPRGFRYLAVIAAGFVATVAAAQDRPPERTERPSPERLRQDLERRLEESKRIQLRLEDAIRRLDAGEKPFDVMGDSSLGPRMRRGTPPKDGPAEAGPGEPPEINRDRVLAMLDEHLPRIGARMRAIAEKDPAIFDRIIQRMRPKFIELEQARKYDSKLFELRVLEMSGSIEILEAIRAVRMARAERTLTPEREAELRSQLAAAVGRQFDAQTQIQAYEVDSVTERLRTIREQLDGRRTDRNAHVEAEVERLMQFGPPRHEDRPAPVRPE